MQTQWCVSSNGATGLNYLVLFHKLDRMNLSREEYDQLEGDVRVMEFAALSAMHKKS
jgi:hypothetical protein